MTPPDESGVYERVTTAPPAVLPQESSGAAVTVPVPRPDPARALVELLHRRDAAEHAAKVLHHEALQASQALRAAAGREGHERAMATYDRERAERLSRICRHCGAPAVDRTGECQCCAVASLGD